MNYNTFSENFRIRSYGHTELALAYFPDLSPDHAWRKLKSWLRTHPALCEYFFGQGCLKHGRTFTPKEVGMIVEDLGEP